MPSPIIAPSPPATVLASITSMPTAAQSTVTENGARGYLPMDAWRNLRLEMMYLISGTQSGRVSGDEVLERGSMISECFQEQLAVFGTSVLTMNYHDAVLRLTDRIWLTSKRPSETVALAELHEERTQNLHQLITENGLDHNGTLFLALIESCCDKHAQISRLVSSLAEVKKEATRADDKRMSEILLKISEVVLRTNLTGRSSSPPRISRTDDLAAKLSLEIILGACRASESVLEKGVLRLLETARHRLEP